MIVCMLKTIMYSLDILATWRYTTPVTLLIASLNISLIGSKLFLIASSRKEIFSHYSMSTNGFK